MSTTQPALEASVPSPLTEPIAIIGMGCLFPKADGLGTYWSNLRDGVDAITAVPDSHWLLADYYDRDPKKPDHTYAQRGGFVPTVSFPALEFGVSPNILEAIDTTQLLGLLVAKHALQDAGYAASPGEGRPFDRNKVSVILGVTGTLPLVIPLGARLGHPQWRRALHAAGVPDAQAQDVLDRIADSYVPWQEDSFPGLLGNVAAGRIANRLDLGGTNCVVDAACASSLSALHLALLELSTGRCEMALTGGFDTFNDIFMYMCFSKTPALSPTGNAQPFSAQGDGTILGEGLGCVLLKKLSAAQREGDRVYALIRSVGTSSDGKGHAIYAPSSAGQVKALQSAYQQAGLAPTSIDLVEAHGTGTKAGDAAEVQALTEVYRGAVGEQARWCALGSVKSMIGHTKAAAGAAGLLKVALALHHKVLPPTLKVSQPLEILADERSPFYVNTVKRPWLPRAGQPRRAALSSFGFGGSNYHCVLEEVSLTATEPDFEGKLLLFACSAPTAAELSAQLDALLPATLIQEPISHEAWADLRILAGRSRAAFQVTQACRLVLVYEAGQSKLPELLAQAKAQLAAGQAQSASGTHQAGPTRGTVFVGHGASPGKVAWLFPGQGSQYVGMLRDLSCHFPQALACLASANEAWVVEPRLSDRIYPVPKFEESQKQADEAALRATQIAQPALGAVSLAAARVLAYFGLQPDLLAGHSYGELVALCLAGRLTEQQLHQLSQLRGQLMSQASGEKSGMLAVKGELAQVQAVLRGDKLDLIIANKNAPSQCVLSGSAEMLERAKLAFGRKQISCVLLPVSAAFHSPFVAAAKEGFGRGLKDVSLPSATVPVYANTSAQPYPESSSEARKLLAGQLAQPVEFVTQITNMHAAGARLFVEVGPSNKLTGLVSAILAGQPHQALALDASSGRRSGLTDLALVLGQLAAVGVPVRLTAWDPHQAGRKLRSEQKPTLTVPLNGANYVKPKPARPAKQPTPAVLPVPTAPVTTPSAVTMPAATMRPTAPTIVTRSPASQSATTVKSSMSTAASANAHSAGSPAPAGPADSTALSQALRLTHEGLLALQKLGEQTAHVHRHYLESQDRALQALQAVLGQQHALLQSGLGLNLALPTMPTFQPTPASMPTVPAMPLPAPAPLPASFTPTPPPAPAPRVSAPPVAPPVQAPVSAPVVQAQPAPSTNGVPASGIQQLLFEVIAQKTGYPADILQPEMELDADLGIDSIKRVEIFSVLQEKLPHAPAVKSEHLGTLRTLKQITEFLTGSATQETVPVHPKQPSPLSGGEGTPANMVPTLESAWFSGHRYVGPSVSLAPTEGEGARLPRFVPHPQPLDEKEPRPELVLDPRAELWLAVDDPELAQSLTRRLDMLGRSSKVIPLTHYARGTRPERLAGLVVCAPPAGTSIETLTDCFRLVQWVGPALRQSAQNSSSALLTVSRLDGTFGLSASETLTDPLSGGLAGIAKTAQHEWPDVSCKALDWAASVDVDEAALAIVEELSLVGPSEVGLTAQGRCQVALVPTALPGESESSTVCWQRGEVVVVTGGARGVTAETAVHLAQQGSPTLVLLGRSPQPRPEAPEVASAQDEAALKRVLFTLSGQKATPRELADQAKQLLAQREVVQNLGRMRAAGAEVHYYSVDVRQEQPLRETLQKIRAEVGPIRGLIHGAGVLADRFIDEQTPEQFRAVLETKVQSCQQLLHELAAEELRAVVLFSSTTARLGRVGQLAYAVANESLNKLAQAYSRSQPTCRVVSVNWGPWDGGMVTPGLKKLFADEGVEVIGLADGAAYLVRELSQREQVPVEVVIVGPGTRLLDDSKPPAHSLPTAGLTLAYERTLSLVTAPVLRGHVLDGKAVVPVALLMEWLAAGAVHAHPGLHFAGLSQFAVLSGLKLRAEQSVSLKVLSGKAQKTDSGYSVPVEIRTQQRGRELLHARAEVLLMSKLSTGLAWEREPSVTPFAHEIPAVYRDSLFHGPEFQAFEKIEGSSAEGIVVQVRSAPAPSAWLKLSLRSSWLSDPLVLDGAFQALVLWCHRELGAWALPMSFGSYRQFVRSFPTSGARVLVRCKERSPSRVLADVEIRSRSGGLLAQLTDCVYVGDPSLRAAFRRNQLQETVSAS